MAIFLVLIITVPGFEDSFYKFIGATGSGAEAALKIDSDTKIHIIDVGQGDAMLLERKGTYALVDAGPPDAKNTLVAYLKDVGVKKLDFVFMTHPHADHIGGMQLVIESFEVGTLILPDFDKAPYPTSMVFINFLEAVEKKGTAAKTAKVGDIYTLSSSEITILQAGIKTKENYNYLSLILVFEADGVRLIASGDAEKANEIELLKSGLDISADILLVGHHGSSTSNSAAFLEAVNPRTAVISCAKDNSYGHPHTEVVKSLEKMNIQSFRTDIEGNIVLGIMPDGKIVYSTDAMLQEPKVAKLFVLINKKVFSCFSGKAYFEPLRLN